MHRHTTSIGSKPLLCFIIFIINKIIVRCLRIYFYRGLNSEEILLQSGLFDSHRFLFKLLLRTCEDKVIEIWIQMIYLLLKGLWVVTGKQ